MELAYLEIPQQAIMLNSWGMKENTACGRHQVRDQCSGTERRCFFMYYSCEYSWGLWVAQFDGATRTMPLTLSSSFPTRKESQGHPSYVWGIV